MNTLSIKVNFLILIFLVIRTAGVLSKDLDEKERTARASFVQKLLNKHKHLEGRIRLVGGKGKFEGKQSYPLRG